MVHNYHEFETPFPPKVYDGPPPVEQGHLIGGDVYWLCECGDRGVSSDFNWARSDVNRHRQNVCTLIDCDTECVGDTPCPSSDCGRAAKLRLAVQNDA